MTKSTLIIGRREFVVIPRKDYERLQRKANLLDAEEAADLAESARRLKDPREKRIPWSEVKKRRGGRLIYRVEFLSSAEREFLRLPLNDRRRIAEHFDTLAENPRPSGCLKLSGHKNLWRIRIGVYRVIYSIDDKLMVISITRVAHRRDSYR